MSAAVLAAASMDVILVQLSAALGVEVGEWDRNSHGSHANLGPYGAMRPKVPEQVWWSVCWWPSRGTVLLETGMGYRYRVEVESISARRSLRAAM